MKNFDFKINNTKLDNLEPILTEWINIHEDFSDLSPEDSLYWYNERANISTLAGAAWKCEGFCLEEFGTTKRHSKNISTYGRTDLWLTCNKAEYYIEAKYLELSITELSNADIRRDKINEALKKARKDAVKVKRDCNGSKPEGQKLGIVFIVPYLTKKHSPFIDEHIKTIIEEIEQEPFDIMAYAFPKKYRKLEYKRYICPGIIMVGRVPRR